MHHVPPAITPLLQEWLAALQQSTVPVHGAYLYGSLALDAWSPDASDIDAVVIIHKPLPEPAVGQLEQIHRDLANHHPLALRLEVMYLPLPQVAADDAAALSYPCFRDGTFHHATQGDLNAVTWWLLHHRGITLMGPSPQKVFPEVPWSAIEQAMIYNLDTYWKQRVEEDGHIRFLHDFWVEFAVTTLCRIMTTLQDHDIIAKEAAIRQWQPRVPLRWQPLLEEAVRLRRHPAAPSGFPTPQVRMEETLAFMKWARGREWLTHSI